MKAWSCSAEMFAAAMGLLCAVVPSLRAELLGATVGNSVLVPCKLPVPLTLHWVYWQEDGTENILIHCDPNCPAASSNDSVTAFESEFRSGNISIRLHGVTAADDRRSFWAFAQYTDAANTEKTCEQCCRATLQVSAPYRDLKLVSDAADAATCTAGGGYPPPSVWWCGRHEADGECEDLHGAETTQEKNPVDGTFSVSSSVSVKELVSVTCRVVGLRSDQSVSLQVDRGAAGKNLWLLLLLIAVAAGIGCLICRRRCAADGQVDAGGGNYADEVHALQQRPAEAANGEHQGNTSQDNEEEPFAGEGPGNQFRPAGSAQPDHSGPSTPRHRGSPRTSGDGFSNIPS